MWKDILNISIISLFQIIIGILWYSKYLFGGYNALFTRTSITPSETTMRKNFIIVILSNIVSSSAIYLITSQIFFLLPRSFYGIIILLTIIVSCSLSLSHFNSSENKDFRIVIVSIGHIFIVTITSFCIALYLLS